MGGCVCGEGERREEGWWWWCGEGGKRGGGGRGRGGKLADSMKKGRHYLHCTPTALPHAFAWYSFEAGGSGRHNETNSFSEKVFPKSGGGLGKVFSEIGGKIREEVWGKDFKLFGESPSVRGSPIIRPNRQTKGQARPVAPTSSTHRDYQQ